MIDQARLLVVAAVASVTIGSGAPAVALTAAFQWSPSGRLGASGDTAEAAVAALRTTAASICSGGNSARPGFSVSDLQVRDTGVLPRRFQASAQVNCTGDAGMPSASEMFGMARMM